MRSVEVESNSIRAVILKYKFISKPVKAALWFVVCNFLLKGISFISGPIFTRVLPEVEYGTISLFYTYEQIILILCTWEIQIGSYQKGLFKYKNNVEGYTRNTLILVNLMTSILFAVLFIFHSWVYKLLGLNIECLVALYLYLMVRPAYDCWQQKKRMEYEYKLPVILILTYSILFVIIPLMSVIQISANANTKFISGLLTGTLFSIPFYFSAVLSKKKYGKGFFKEYSLYNMRFQGPFVFHSLSFLVLAQADRIMIGMYSGEKDVAFYSVAYSIANTVMILQSSINQSLLPWMYHSLESEKYERIKSITKYILIFLGMLILMFLIIVPEGMRILFPGSYYDSLWCIPPISASVFFIFLYSLFVNYESYYEKTKYVSYVSIICALMNIVMNYFGIRWFGYIAGAYTTLISYILFAVGHYYFMNRVRKEINKEKRPFDMPMIFFLSISFLLACFLITYLYRYFLIRYVFLAIFLLLIFIMRNKVISLFKFIKKSH